MASLAKSLPDWVAVVVFGLYSLGLLVMFAWTVTSVYKGKIRVFTAVASRSSARATPKAKGDEDKEGGGDDGTLSLSKLQMFLWTLVMIFAWLFQLVKHPGVFPVLPNQALLLMGISGAAYLGAKHQGIAAERDRQRSKAQGGGV